DFFATARSFDSHRSRCDLPSGMQRDELSKRPDFAQRLTLTSEQNVTSLHPSASAVGSGADVGHHEAVAWMPFRDLDQRDYSRGPFSRYLDEHRFSQRTRRQASPPPEHLHSPCAPFHRVLPTLYTARRYTPCHDHESPVTAQGELLNRTPKGFKTRCS